MATLPVSYVRQLRQKYLLSLVARSGKAWQRLVDAEPWPGFYWNTLAPLHLDSLESPLANTLQPICFQGDDQGVGGLENQIKEKGACYREISGGAAAVWLCGLGMAMVIADL